MLYGIGIAFDPKFKFHYGYKKWVQVLDDFLKTNKLVLGSLTRSTGLGR